MAKWQVESGVAHGRGFSQQDPNGLCAKITSFMKRPAANGTPQTCTVDAGTNNITCAGHGYVTGESVSFTSTTTLPSPLAINTEYYVIYVDTNTFQLATSYYLSSIGTVIDITDAGTGTHSVYALGGGANWYIYDDLSDVTVKTFLPAAVDYATNDTITINSHGLNTGRIVRITSSGTMIGGVTSNADQWVIRVDQNTIKLAASYYDAYNGTARNLTSAGTGTHSLEPRDPAIVFCDTQSPTVNNVDEGPSGGPAKFLKVMMPSATSARIALFYAMWHDTTLHFTAGIWNGRLITTEDDVDFIYNIRGGDEGFWLHTLVGTTWYEQGWDECTGISNLVEGTDKYGYLQSAITAGTNVVLQLDTGEAANFTQNKYYYMIDFSQTQVLGHRKVNTVQYVLVSSVDTGSDQITIAACSYDFGAGTLIGAYPHRWVAIGTAGSNDNVPNVAYNLLSCIPYSSHYNSGVAGAAFHNQTGKITGSCQFSWSAAALSTMNPDDDSLQAVQRPLILEYSYPSSGTSNYTTGCNRAYFVPKNFYLAYNNTWLAGSYGKVINGKNYIFFKTVSNVILYNYSSNNEAVLILDTESTS